MAIKSRSVVRLCNIDEEHNRRGWSRMVDHNRWSFVKSRRDHLKSPFIEDQKIIEFCHTAFDTPFLHFPYVVTVLSETCIIGGPQVCQ
jgi:hypothetical protein